MTRVVPATFHVTLVRILHDDYNSNKTIIPNFFIYPWFFSNFQPQYLVFSACFRLFLCFLNNLFRFRLLRAQSMDSVVNAA